MGLLKILRYGHPRLRETATELKTFGSRERDLIAAMAETMYAAEGIGLASTQVGVMDRLFVIDVDQRNPDDDEDDDDGEEGEDNDGGTGQDAGPKEVATLGEAVATRTDRNPGQRLLRVFINPEIISESEEDEPFKEGCLSIPNVEGEVYRPSRLRIAARDENFEPFEADLDGLLARVFQHEFDHLNGIMFVDKLNMLRRSAVAGKLMLIKRKALDELLSLPNEYPIPKRGESK